MPALLPPSTAAILFADYFQQYLLPLVALLSQVASPIALSRSMGGVIYILCNSQRRADGLHLLPDWMRKISS